MLHWPMLNTRRTWRHLDIWQNFCRRHRFSFR